MNVSAHDIPRLTADYISRKPLEGINVLLYTSFFFISWIILIFRNVIPSLFLNCFRKKKTAPDAAGIVKKSFFLKKEKFVICFFLLFFNVYVVYRWIGVVLNIISDALYLPKLITGYIPLELLQLSDAKNAYDLIGYFIFIVFYSIFVYLWLNLAFVWVSIQEIQFFSKYANKEEEEQRRKSLKRFNTTKKAVKIASIFFLTSCCVITFCIVLPAVICQPFRRSHPLALLISLNYVASPIYVCVQFAITFFAVGIAITIIIVFAKSRNVIAGNFQTNATISKLHATETIDNTASEIQPAAKTELNRSHLYAQIRSQKVLLAKVSIAVVLFILAVLIRLSAAVFYLFELYPATIILARSIPDLFSFLGITLVFWPFPLIPKFCIKSNKNISSIVQPMEFIEKFGRRNKSMSAGSVKSVVAGRPNAYYIDSDDDDEFSADVTTDFTDTEITAYEEEYSGSINNSEIKQTLI